MLKFRNCSIKHRHWYSKERSRDFFLLQTVKFEGHRPFTKTIWKSRRFNFRRVVCRIVGRPLGTSFKFCMEGVGLAQAESIVGRGNVYVAKWRHNCNANLCTERVSSAWKFVGRISKMPTWGNFMETLLASFFDWLLRICRSFPILVLNLPSKSTLQ